MERGMESAREQEILKRIGRLAPEDIEEVIHFIEFLSEKKPKSSPFVQALTTRAGPRVSLGQVRKRLARLQGKMSDTVRELRDERL